MIQLGRSPPLRGGGLIGYKDSGASRKKGGEKLPCLKSKGFSAMIINRELVDTKGSGKLRSRTRSRLVFLHFPCVGLQYWFELVPVSREGDC